MPTHERQAAERIWRRNKDDHAAAHLATWAKQANRRRERKRRWAAIAELARDRRLNKLDAHQYREAHAWRLRYRWARAKVRRLKRKIRRSRKPPSPNTYLWGGSYAAGEREVVKNANDYGVWISSRKRPPDHYLSLANPGSDHNAANTTAYAWDLATFNGAPLAHAIARDLGISNYSTGNYNGYTVRRPWGTYRAQILWAVAGHYNHVHVGLRRV